MEWHDDVFTVPEGFAELARTPSGRSWSATGRVLATQFHPEATDRMVTRWLADGGAEQLPARGRDPDALLAETRANTAEQPARAAEPRRLVPDRPVAAANGPLVSWRAVTAGLVASEPMSAFLRDYLTVVWFGLAALLLGGLLLGVAALIRPSRPNPSKLIAYESGVDPVGIGWSQSQIRYYVFALLFVIFDVEAVFIFPWAASIERYGAFGLVEMLIFIVAAARGLRVRVEARAAAMGLVDRGRMPGRPHQAVQPRPLVLACGCTSGASPAAPSRWARRSPRRATT